VEKCVACQFYDRDDADVAEKGVRWGKCRRTGPMVHPVSTKAYMVEGIWPQVRDDDWCGEWAAKTRRIDTPAADPRNLLMQAAAASVRTSTVPTSSLMTPLPVAPAADAPHLPGPRSFGSD
jgi:hypothetical protein